MKKALLITFFASLLAPIAYASPNDNGFNDVYTVVNGNVLSGSVVSGPITFQKISDTSFLLSEPTGMLTGGIATVSLGPDSQHYCNLTIQDIDFNTPALIAQQCTPNEGVASFNATYDNVTIILKSSQK